MWLSSFPFCILYVGFGENSVLYHEMYTVCLYNALLSLTQRWKWLSIVLDGLGNSSVNLKLHETVILAFLEITQNSFTFIEGILICTGLTGLCFATFSYEVSPVVSVLSGVLLISLPTLILLNLCILKLAAKLHLSALFTTCLIYFFSALLVFLVSRSWVAGQLGQAPEVWLFNQIFSHRNSLTRIKIIIWWIICLGCFIFILLRSNRNNPLGKYFTTEDEVLNFRRKTYHALVVFLFLPVCCLDPHFLHLSFSGVLFIFLFVEGIRILRLKPFGKMIHEFLWEYTDNRDHKGPLIISHIYLLIGCAIPIWLSNALKGPVASVELLVGVLCLGCGDSMASIIGKRFGKHRISKTNKSIEGVFAFSISVFLVLHLTQAFHVCPSVTFWKTLFMSLCTAILEGVSTENDNLILPMYMWVLYQALD